MSAPRSRMTFLIKSMIIGLILGSAGLLLSKEEFLACPRSSAQVQGGPIDNNMSSLDSTLSVVSESLGYCRSNRVPQNSGEENGTSEAHLDLRIDEQGKSKPNSDSITDNPAFARHAAKRRVLEVLGKPSNNGKGEAALPE